MAIEIVDLPSYKMVDLSSSLCKRWPEGIFIWLVISTYPTYGQYALIWFNPIDYHT